MLANTEDQIIAVLRTVFDHFGWFGVAGIMAFENAASITPSEIILALAGWRLIAAPGAPPVLILVGGLYAALGSAVGSSITYWLVRLGGRPVVDRVTRWCRVDPRHLARAEAQFQRWGPALVLYGRMLPIVRVVVTIPAGLARMPFLRYFTYTFIGAYGWCTLLIGLGYAVGHQWPLIGGQLKQFVPWFLAALVALGGLGWLARRLIQPRLRPALAPVRADDGD